MQRWHVLVGVIALSTSLWFFLSQPKTSVERAMNNYSEELLPLSKKYKLPWKFLMALVVLECSGETECSPRFDKHEYEQLQRLKEGKKKKHGQLSRSDIENASEETIKNLSSSWGPFQIMGSRSVFKGITVEQLHSEEGLAKAVQWIDSSYGERLRKQEFQDAFHIHNTGTPFPKSGSPSTHDPQYVFRGISLMKEFEDMRTKNQ